MEKPDANGYVHVTWPSERVPHGGIFHTKVPEPSTERQHFLKVLLEESKLSIAQRRKDAYTLRQEKKKSSPEKEMVHMICPRTSRRRSLSAIRESGIFEIEQYRPLKRGEDRERMKENLANQMAYGDKEVQQSMPQPPRIKKSEITLPTKKEQWEELVNQIRERSDWLAEMEQLGQAGPHRALVNDQIAERLRALDALGIGSQGSTPRSAATSAKSTELNARSRASVTSKQSLSISEKPKISNRSSRRKTKEENVLQYENVFTAQYSPRRRV